MLAKKDDNTSNSDNKVASERAYTKIDDGSPLGVAIVVLGGSFLAFSGSESVDPTSIWIVFASASIAAGLSRLLRYHKREND